MNLHEDENIELTLNQYELKYYPILNFGAEIGPVMKHFFPLFDKVQAKTDPGKEDIQLISQKEGYIIFLRSNMMILRFDASVEDINPSFTPVKTFFNIFNKLKELPSFSMVTTDLLVNLFVRLNEKSSEENSNDFRRYHFNEKYENFAQDSFTDCTIKLERHTENQVVTFEYGPYVGIHDIKNRGLDPISKDWIPALESKIGFLLELKQASARELDEVNLKSFYNLIKHTVETKQNIYNG